MFSEFDILSMLGRLKIGSFDFFLCAEQTRNHCVDTYVVVYTVTFSENVIGIESIN